MKSRLDKATTTTIKNLVDRFCISWNAKDLDAFLEPFHADAEFTDVVNQTALGKPAIRKQHEFAFKVVMKNAYLEISHHFIRSIVPDVVLVTANWLVKNSQTPDGKMLPDRNGVIQFAISKDQNANWKIKLVHNADFALPYQKQERFIK